MSKKSEIRDEIQNPILVVPILPASTTSMADVVLMPRLGIHRLTASVDMPKYQTSKAGCFDVQVNLGEEIKAIKIWNPMLHREEERAVREDSTGRYIILLPGERGLFPSGLVCVIPAGYALLGLSRSSTGLKRFIQLAQSAAYIDEDYRGELLLPLMNTSSGNIKVMHLDRLIQFALVPYVQADIQDLKTRPELVGNRTGGFGSTNSKAK